MGKSLKKRRHHLYRKKNHPLIAEAAKTLPASTLTQNVTGPLGPVISKIYWSCKHFTGPTNCLITFEDILEGKPECPQIFTGPVVEFFYWPEVIFGNVSWPCTCTNFDVSWGSDFQKNALRSYVDHNSTYLYNSSSNILWIYAQFLRNIESDMNTGKTCKGSL